MLGVPTDVVGGGDGQQTDGAELVIAGAMPDKKESDGEYKSFALLRAEYDASYQASSLFRGGKVVSQTTIHTFMRSL